MKNKMGITKTVRWKALCVCLSVSVSLSVCLTDLSQPSALKTQADKSEIKGNELKMLTYKNPPFSWDLIHFSSLPSFSFVTPPPPSQPQVFFPHPNFLLGVWNQEVLRFVRTTKTACSPGNDLGLQLPLLYIFIDTLLQIRWRRGGRR